MARVLQTQEDKKHDAKLRQEIKNKSERLGYSKYTGHLTYRLKQDTDIIKFFRNKTGWQGVGEVIFYFWAEDTPETNGMQYRTTETMFWHWTTVNDFHAMLYDHPQIEYIVHSRTSSETPKLSKPKELRGIKQITSIPYIGDRGKCGLFIRGDDVWIKHTDYFSPIIDTPKLRGAPIGIRADHLGMPEPKRKFIYTDNWGSIVAKREAWLEIANLYMHIHEDTNENNIAHEILAQIGAVERISYQELVNTHMSRFLEQVIKELKAHKLSAVEEE